MNEMTSGVSSDNQGDDPTDEQVKNNCSDIVVNDITIPVDIPGESTQLNTLTISEPTISEPTISEPTISEPTISEPVVEIKYDNVDLTSDKNVPADQDRFKRLMTNMEVKEEINVVKSNEIATPITDISVPNLVNLEPSNSEPSNSEPSKSTFSLNSLYPNMNTNNITDNRDSELVPPLQIIQEDKQVNIGEPKSPRKDMVIVKNDDDIDETSSLANFFDDMKKIVEDKGIKVETNIDKSYSLFEDALIVEN